MTAPIPPGHDGLIGHIVVSDAAAAITFYAQAFGAEEICRSPMTVDNHRKSIMKKLDINDRGELVRFAIAEGLVEV